MRHILTFDTIQITTETQEIAEIEGGYILTGSPVSLHLPFIPEKYFIHGWQSWGLTAWVPASNQIHTPRPYALHPMQIDPVYAFESVPNGSHLGAVSTLDGNILFLGALGLETHVALYGSLLNGWAESGSPQWFVAYGKEEKILAQYSNLLGAHFGKGRFEKAPRIWCSWYSLYTEIYESQLLNILTDLAEMPFDVFQIDDGWQRAIGDWEPNSKFPGGMGGMAAQIKATGRQAGLWLAPLLVVPSSKIYREHADWLLRDEHGKLVSAGFNWNEQLFALDTTHPEALDWLATLMKKVREWGYDYVKLDFLYAGALPGKRRIEMPREAAYRNGLKIIREALGEAYFLTCGAPVIPSIGLCDGIRIGPDMAEYWASERFDLHLNNFTMPGTRNGLRTSINRLWLAPVMNTDPDVVYFRGQKSEMTEEQRRLMQDLGSIAGFKATSDIPAWWTEDERMAAQNYFNSAAEIERTGRYTFKIDGQIVDFEPYIGIPEHSWVSLILSGIIGPLSDNETVRKINDYFSKQKVKKMVEGTQEQG